MPKSTSIHCIHWTKDCHFEKGDVKNKPDFVLFNTASKLFLSHFSMVASNRVDDFVKLRTQISISRATDAFFLFFKKMTAQS